MSLIIVDGNLGHCASGCRPRLRWNYGLAEKYCQCCGRSIVQFDATDDFIRDMDAQDHYQCPCGLVPTHRSDRECREAEPAPKKKRRIVMP